MSVFLRKYATATTSGSHIGIPMPKAGSADFATGSDWTPAAGDCTISIDGGTPANITTLPTYTNGWWIFSFTIGETTGKSIRVKVVDAATKVVDDQAFLIETFGNASAMHVLDYSGSALDASLISTGLDRITLTPQVGNPTTFRGAVVWLFRRFARVSKTPTTLVVKDDAGTTVTTQTITDDGAGNQTIGIMS